MQTLCIIELTTHIELIEQWYLLLENSTHWDVKFILHEKFRTRVSAAIQSKTNFINPQKKDPSHALLNYIEEKDYILINTLQEGFENYQKLLDQKPCAIIAHNLNFTQFGYLKIDFQSIKQKNWRDFKYFLKMFLWYRPHHFFIKNKAHIQWLSLVNNPDFKSVIPISLAVNHFFNPRKTSQTIKIVIAGEISNKRKNINQIIQVLEKIKPKTPLFIHFLGKISDKKLLQRISTLKKTKNLNYQYHTQRISKELFEENLKTADLLLCPSQAFTDHLGVREVYGKTKLSGNVLDCIQLGKVALFPSYYPMHHWETIFYKNDLELIHLLENLTPDILDKHYQNLATIIPNYTLNQLQKQLEIQLNNIFIAK